jgi:hypothetical protein
MIAALVHVAALLAIMQAPVIVLPKDTCRIDPKSLAGTTIELVSDSRRSCSKPTIPIPNMFSSVTV